jgi:hypothetical protein
LVAASCLAHISNNDQLRDEVGPAENVNASAAENFDNQAAIVYEGLNDENDANINATAVETLCNQAIDNEWQNHEIINATVGNVNRELDDRQDSGDTRISDLDGRTIQHLKNQLTIMDGRIYDYEQRVWHLQTMLHSMCNRDEQPSANTSFRCTSPGFTNKDYARRYAGSPLSFDRNYGEIDKSQTLEVVECIDGNQKQKSKKRRCHQNKDRMEEVECIDGNQKQKSKKEDVVKRKIKGQ